MEILAKKTEVLPEDAMIPEVVPEDGIIPEVAPEDGITPEGIPEVIPENAPGGWLYRHPGRFKYQKRLRFSYISVLQLTASFWDSAYSFL